MRTIYVCVLSSKHFSNQFSLDGSTPSLAHGLVAKCVGVAEFKGLVVVGL